ncbi:MAG: DUF4926 domain-containing protein [Ignavibacteriae bacterium]|nr:DUF4926 domain-containing protein [Ignavibacteriota bacterium]
MKFKLYTEVKLISDIAGTLFKKGDVGTIIEHYEPNTTIKEHGYTLEMFNALGDTLTTIDVSESQIKAISNNELFSIRTLEPELA